MSKRSVFLCFLLFLFFEKNAFSESRFLPFYQPNLLISQQEARDNFLASLIVSIEQNTKDSYYLRYQWFDQVGAACFTRHGETWLIFDHFLAYFDLSVFNDLASIIRNVEVIPNQNALILHFWFDPDWKYVRIFQKDLSWIMEVSKEPINNKQVFPSLSPNAGTKDSDILFPTKYPSMVLHWKDSVLGDEFWVGTASSEDLFAFNKKHNFPDFSLIPSYVGLVITTESKKISMHVKNEKGYYITVPFKSGVDFESSGPIAKNARLFDFRSWRGSLQKTYLAKERDLKDQAAEIPMHENKDSAYLHLAQLYLTYGAPIKALAYIHMMNKKNRDTFAIEAASNLIMGHIDQAKTMFFNNSIIPDIDEANVWRAFILQRLGKSKEADVLYSKSHTRLVLKDYPDYLSNMFFLNRIQMFLNTRQLRAAKTLLNDPQVNNLTLHQKNTVKYDRGKLMELESHKYQDLYDYYFQLLKEVDPRNDPLNFYRILFEYIKLGVNLRHINSNFAIHLLRQIQMSWRGDSLEKTTLKLILKLELQEEDYLAALHTLSSMKYNASSLEEKNKAQDRMKQIFINYFMNEKKVRDNVPYSLALYNHYRFLATDIQEFRVIFNNLINGLIHYGSIRKAIELLRFQIQHDTKNSDKQSLCLKLVYLDLLINEPKTALSDFNLTKWFGFSNESTRIKRQQLKAQVLILLKRYNDALHALAGYIDPISDRLRLNIAWYLRDWNGMVDILQRLVGSPPYQKGEFTDEKARYVLSWLIALKMLSNQNGANVLDHVYGSFMKGTGYEKLYNFILPAPVTEISNLEKTLQELIENNNFHEFMKEFKKSMIRDGIY